MKTESFYRYVASHPEGRVHIWRMRSRPLGFMHPLAQGLVNQGFTVSLYLVWGEGEYRVSE